MEKLINAAFEAKKKAYAPYSHFHVGAALLTKDGKIYQGANIENSSYSLTVCAERTAVFSAVLSGERKFKSIAITSDSKDLTPPCGACRQVLMELCGEDLEVILVNAERETKTFKLKELLPYSFGSKQLNNR